MSPKTQRLDSNAGTPPSAREPTQPSAEGQLKTLEELREFAQRTSPESQEVYEASLERALEALKNQDGIAKLPELPAIVIPDIHARREMIVEILDQKIGGQTVFELLKEGKITVVCLGDGMHTEDPAAWQFDGMEQVSGILTPEQQAAKQKMMDEEMTRSFGAMKMIMDLKATVPENFHYLRGNHDVIDDPSLAFAKYGLDPQHGMAGESTEVKNWVENNFGSDFLQKYAAFEDSLPVVAIGENFVASHAAPDRVYTSQILAQADRQRIRGLMWTDNTDPSQTPLTQIEHAIDVNLTNLGFDPADPSKKVWIIGHRPVPASEGPYRSQLDGELIQINNNERYAFAYLEPGKDFNPETASFLSDAGGKFNLAETPPGTRQAEIISSDDESSDRSPRSRQQEIQQEWSNLRQAYNEKLMELKRAQDAASSQEQRDAIEAERQQATEQFNQHSQRINQELTALRADQKEPGAKLEPETPPGARQAEIISSNDETAIRQRILEDFKQQQVGSAEVFTGAERRNVRLPSQEKKRAWAQVFDAAMHEQIVALEQQKLLGQITDEEMLAELGKDERNFFYLFYADARKIKNEQDVLRVGLALKQRQEQLLEEARSGPLSRSPAFSENLHTYQREDLDQKTRDAALLRFIENNVYDPGLQEELRRIFWTRLEVEGHLRGESDEQMAQRKQEMVFLGTHQRQEAEGHEGKWERLKMAWHNALYELDYETVPYTETYVSLIEAMGEAQARATLREIFTEDLEKLVSQTEARLARVPTPGAAATAETQAAAETQGEVNLAEVIESLGTPEGLTQLAKLIQEQIESLGLRDSVALGRILEESGFSKSKKFIEHMANRVWGFDKKLREGTEITAVSILAALWFLLQVFLGSSQSKK